MRHRPRALLLLALLPLGACADLDVGFAVALELRYGASVDDAVLGGVQQLRFRASGEESSESTVALGRPAQREERVLYRPLNATRSIAIAVTAETAQGKIVAAGATGTLSLEGGATTRAELTLEAPGSGGDGGVGDGGAGDGAGRTGCGNLSVLLCEDFETGLPVGTLGRWNTSTQHGSVTIDNGKAHRGNSSLHLHVDAVTAGQVGEARLEQTSVLPGQVLFARAWFYFPSLTPTSALGAVSMFTIQMSPAPYGGIYFQAELGATDAAKLANVGNFGSAGYYVSTDKVLPVGQWFCAEWELDNIDGNAGAKGASRGWVGDVLRVDGTAGIQTRNTPPLDTFWIGQYWQDGSAGFPAFDMWVDDLIIDDTRVTCAK